MISDALRERLACPLCLEDAGCPVCARPDRGHEACLADYGRRAGCPCGGPDKRRLERTAQALVCPCCRVSYAVHPGGGYVDLVPRTSVGAVTRYADHEFHEHLPVTDAPPVLSARVKADMMRRMLAPAPGEALLDLGCGAGKLALFAAEGGSPATGVDVAPFFLRRAELSLDLVLGDLRRLPFRKAAFPCAYSLDVLEHLDEAGVGEVLREARRTVGERGRLFVYTHAMESSALAGFQRAVNRLARRLGRAGLLDQEREALRKSDHRNAIRSHEHFETICAAAGLRVAERRYYNVFLKAVVEDLGLRLYQQARRWRDDRRGRKEREGRAVKPTAPAEGPRPGRSAFALALALTWLLKLDVVLFGGVRTGPFFARLEPAPPPPGAGA